MDWASVSCLLVAMVIGPVLGLLYAIATLGNCPKGGAHKWQATDRFRERQCGQCGKRQYLMREWEDC